MNISAKSEKNISEELESLFFGEYAPNPLNFQFSPQNRKQISTCIKHTKHVVDLYGPNLRLDYFRAENTDNLGKDIHTKCVTLPDLGLIFRVDTRDMQPRAVTEPTIDRTFFFLNKLMAVANKNATTTKKGFRFDDDIKSFASYFRMLAGPMAYETVQRNLEAALPSISTTNRYISKVHDKIVEGVLRSEELLTYLIERKLPLFVSISEDATRITGRVEYDPKTNQLLGLVLPISDVNGMPTPFTYMARNAEEIFTHLSKKNAIGHFVNVIMAKPLSPSPSFCLAMFSSDSKYSSTDVSKRWNHIVQELRKHNITVLSIASDSDPKYNSAMRLNSRLGVKSKLFVDKDWFLCGSVGPFYIQDPIHIITKLRNFFLKSLKTTRKYRFGNKYHIKMQHLTYLVRNFSKDQHQLTASILNPTDRQNFSSCQRMCDQKVIELLKANVKDSVGTVSFLEMMRDIIAAFMDDTLYPSQRIMKIWYWTFVMRIWRLYVRSKSGLTLKENFLTQNCYVCIELNAHSLILIMLYLKRHNLGHLFKPKYMDSQPCEQLFRQARSFTSTYSTVTNCSVKEMLNRVNKIQLQSDIALNSNFEFPRTNKNKISENEHVELPTVDEICEIIEDCQLRALNFAKKHDLLDKSFEGVIKCDINASNVKETEEEYVDLVDDEIADQKPIPELKFGRLLLKDFSERFEDVPVFEHSPFAEIVDSHGKKMVVKKSSLCWLWREEAQKLSSDRLHRVKTRCRRANDSLISIERKKSKTMKKS